MSSISDQTPDSPQPPPTPQLTPPLKPSGLVPAELGEQAPAQPPATPPLPPPTSLRPVAPAERQLLLDVLRGVALLGIFMVNMPTFAMPFFEAFGSPALVDGPARDRIAWWIVSLFFQFKFVTLFSLLFGAGFAMQLERAQARGRPFIWTYLRRLGVLCLIGLVHALLIWYGDILVAYSILGLLLLPFARVRGRVLVAAGIAIVVVSAILGGLFGALQAVMAEQPWPTEEAMVVEVDLEDGQEIEFEADTAPGDAASAPAPPRGLDALIAAQFNPLDPLWTEGETMAFRDGPFLDALIFRTTIWALAIVVGLFTWLWHPAGVFLIGAGLMRLGFFRPESAALRARCAWLTIPGLALEAVVPWVTQRGGWSGDLASMVLASAHAPSAVLLSIGYVGLISIAVDAAGRRGALHVVARFIGNAGRMPLTVYLAESVLAGALMYWWGLGWFGSVDRLSQIGLVLAIWLALAAFANLWFRGFTYGPMEWVWRVGTYGRWTGRDAK